MPVYNEVATLEEVVRAVLAQPLVGELIIVDDGSNDGTPDVLTRLQSSDPRIVVQRHPVNRGKGAALRTGFAAANFPIVVVQDADLEYDPSEYERVLEPILDGRADVVFGSRFVGPEAHRVLYSSHSVGNRFLTLLSNVFTDLSLTDMETGFKAFRRDVIQKIDIKEDRFGIEPEITAKVARLNVRVHEVAISYSGRTYSEGKKATWRDGLSALRCIIQYNLLDGR